MEYWLKMDWARLKPKFYDCTAINIMSTQYDYHLSLSNSTSYTTYHHYHFFYFQNNYQFHFRSSFLDEFLFLPELGVVKYIIREHEHRQLIVNHRLNMLYPAKIACNIFIFSECWSRNTELVLLNILFFSLFYKQHCIARATWDFLIT